jgi:uncharacterized protein (DUF58 family)
MGFPDLLRRMAAGRESSWHDAPRTLLRAEDAARLIAQAQGARAAQTARPVEQRGAGDSLSAWLGRGLDYAESRAYQPGDDLRGLHWRLLARTGKPFVRVHQEEQAPSWHALLDLRGGMQFGTQLRTKAEQAARMALLACATQALAAEGAAGTMGLTLWRERLQALDLGRGLPAVRRLTQQLLQTQILPLAQTGSAAPDAASTASAFTHWAQRLGRTLHGGSRLVLISDGAGWDAPEIDAALWALRSRADVLLLLVHDPVETALPASAVLHGARFVDLAQHQAGVLPDAAQSRTAFAHLAQQRRAALLARWRSRGLVCIEAGVEHRDADVLRALRTRCAP